MAKSKSIGVPGVAVLFGTTALYLVYVGVKDVPFVDGLRELLKGNDPNTVARSSGGYEPVELENIGTRQGESSGAGPASSVTGPVPQSDTVVVAGTNIRVHKSIVGQVLALIMASRAAGINFGGYGWRSNAEQRRLRTTNGCPDVMTSPASSCRTPTAIPGQSMHERGLAIDFTIGGRVIGRNDRAHRWLVANAARYGLKPLASEPWHWSTNGS